MPDVGMKDLNALRGNLRGIVQAAWKTKEAKEFKKSLEGVFPDAAREEYRACIDGATPRACLRKVAEDHNIRAAFEGAWANAPAALLDKLETVGTAWTAALRDQIMKVIEGADIPELYSLCMEGDFSTVVSKLGLPAQPGSFRECATAVAKAKDLRKKLRAAWGKRA